VALVFSLAVALLFSAFRLLSDSTSTTLSLINEASFLERIYTVPTILWTYVRLFFWPYPLHMEYHFVESSLWNYSALFIVFVLVAVYIAYKTLSSKEFLFGILFFVIMLLPVSQIVFPLASTIREHWLALPSIGLLLVLGLILEKLYAKVWLFFLGIIFVFAMLTVIRNLDWTDAKRLYSHDLKFEPNSFVMHNNLGLVYYRENIMSQAELCFRRSIEISPNQGYDVALNNLGVIEENKQRYQQAANLYYRSIQVGQYQLAYVNLARLAFQVNDYDAAIKIGEEGLQKYPNNSSLEQIIEASYKNKR
jgi:tetratricopeptide (TPR) repeat protein